MIKLFSNLIKFAIFSIAILVLGNYFRWDGKTVSDQIQTRVSHAENSDMAAKLKNWSKELIDDTKKAPSHSSTQGNSKKSSRTAAASSGELAHEPLTAPLVSKSNSGELQNPSEEIPPTERQKLRALIRELNSPLLSAKNIAPAHVGPGPALKETRTD